MHNTDDHTSTSSHDKPTTDHTTLQTALKRKINTLQHLRNKVTDVIRQSADIQNRAQDTAAKIDLLLKQNQGEMRSLGNTPTDEVFYDTVAYAPVSAELHEYKNKVEHPITTADIRYFSKIPAHLTRVESTTNTRYGRLKRGDVVVITRQYTSKIRGQQFPQLNLVGIVIYYDKQEDRIGITVAPDMTIEKYWKNTEIITDDTTYKPAHENDVWI